MSNSMRQRDWMFSSVASGFVPANSPASVASVAFIISPMGNTLYFTPMISAWPRASSRLICEV
jgi:hypothetical protein